MSFKASQVLLFLCTCFSQTTFCHSEDNMAARKLMGEICCCLLWSSLDLASKMTRQQHICQSNVKMSLFALCSNNNNNALQHQQTSVTGWWQCKWKQHQQQWHNVLGRPQATVLFKGIASHGSTFPCHSETQTDGPAQCTMTRSRLSSGFARFFQSRHAHSRHVMPVAVLINSLNWNWGTWHSCSKSRTMQ